MNCNMPGFPVLHYLLEFAQIYVHWVSDCIQLSHSLSPLLLLPSIFPSIKIFPQWFSSLHKVAKVLELQLQHHLSNAYSGLISFRIDWFDLLAVQGTQVSSPTPKFKSINSLASVLFMVQASHPYMPTGKKYIFAYMDFVSKAISLLFNILSRFNMLSMFNTLPSQTTTLPVAFRVM